MVHHVELSGMHCNLKLSFGNNDGLFIVLFLVENTRAVINDSVLCVLFPFIFLLPVLTFIVGIL